MASIFEHAGGQQALHDFIDVFYSSVLADPILHPLFGDGRPEHVDHLTAFEAESFGGPDTFTHLAAADAAGLPTDAPFREALRSHVEFGSHVAMQNSHARTEDELHPLREVPKWEWPG